MEGRGTLSRAEAAASAISRQEGPLSGLDFLFRKVTPQPRLPRRVMVCVSRLSIIINSSVSFHPSKPPGLDDKSSGHRSLRLLGEAAEQGRGCEGVRGELQPHWRMWVPVNRRFKT